MSWQETIVAALYMLCQTAVVLFFLFLVGRCSGVM
jgi:hypothetical protein